MNAGTSGIGQTKLPACSSALPPSRWDNCQGVYASENGKIIAEFKNGQPNGQGTMTFANGTKYVGEFKDG